MGIGQGLWGLGDSGDLPIYRHAEIHLKSPTHEPVFGYLTGSGGERLVKKNCSETSLAKTHCS